MLGLLLLAVAAKSAGLYATPSYLAYRKCLGDAVRDAATTGVVPEDLSAALRQSCAEPRAQLADEIAHRAGHQPNDDPDASAREVEARTGDLVASYTRRYAIYYNTGIWPRE